MRILLLFVSSITLVRARCFQGPASCDCYEFVSSADSWYTAEWICENIDGHLASVGNAFINSFLESEVHSWFSGDYWLGGSNDDRTSAWTWSDGSPFKYKNWDARQPGADSPMCLAASTTSGKWSAKPCDQSMPYVCRVPATAGRNCPTPITTRTPPPAHPACPAGLPTTAVCTCADKQCIKGQICDPSTGTCSPSVCPAAGVAPAGGCICGDNGVSCDRSYVCNPATGTCAAPSPPLCARGWPANALCACRDKQCVKGQICDASGPGVCSPPTCPASGGAPAGGCVCGDNGVWCIQPDICAPATATCTAPALPACTDGAETDSTCICGDTICRVGQYCHATVSPKCLDVCSPGSPVTEIACQCVQKYGDGDVCFCGQTCIGDGTCLHDGTTTTQSPTTEA